jgi:hypothetical protein
VIATLREIMPVGSRHLPQPPCADGGVCRCHESHHNDAAAAGAYVVSGEPLAMAAVIRSKKLFRSWNNCVTKNKKVTAA